MRRYSGRPCEHLEYATRRPQAVRVDPSLVLLLKVTGGVWGVALSVYVLARLISAARKAGRTGAGGEIVGIFVMLFGPAIAPPPPHEMATGRCTISNPARSS